jgi:outer membrane protein OmpA-like peptidoglycan-associated protein
VARHRIASTWCIALLLACFASPAIAAPINHFEAAAGPHNYIVTNHPAVLPHLVPSAWLLTSYAHDPLVFRDGQGNEVAKIVEHQVNVELAAALGLFDRFEVGLVLPGLFFNGPGLDGAGLNEFAVGDIRFFGKVLLTPWNEGFVASFRLQSSLIPIAQLNNQAGVFAGEQFPNVTPAFTIGYSSTFFRAGFDVGYLLRVPSEIDPKLIVGSELVYGLAGEIDLLPKFLAFTVDLNGRSAFAGLGSNQNAFPLEVDAGLKAFFGPLVGILGAGTGIVPDYGTPDFRVFLGLGFRPQSDDRDHDGVADGDDKCPDAPEDKDGFQDADGCPDVDNDGDGILDGDDKCPMQKEDNDRWQDADGCPDVDNDGDGILDDADNCPNDPETKNGFEDEDGCPDDREKKVIVVTREKIEINDRIYFAYDSDRILPRSYELLDNVAKVINGHTEIPAVFVEGHTDSDGKDTYNLELSDRRAKSVRAYLVQAGVAANRLKAKGFGEASPIADNNTEAGKAENRRVEFRIVNLDDKVPDTDAPKLELQKSSTETQSP